MQRAGGSGLRAEGVPGAKPRGIPPTFRNFVSSCQTAGILESARPEHLHHGNRQTLHVRTPSYRPAKKKKKKHASGTFYPFR